MHSRQFSVLTNINLYLNGCHSTVLILCRYVVIYLTGPFGEKFLLFLNFLHALIKIPSLAHDFCHKLSGILLTMYLASLVAQMIKNLPAVQKTSVQSLGWEDPLERGKATHSSILAWRIPWTEEPGGHSPWDHKELGHDWGTKPTTSWIFTVYNTARFDSLWGIICITLSRIFLNLFLAALDLHCFMGFL